MLYYFCAGLFVFMGGKRKIQNAICPVLHTDASETILGCLGEIAIQYVRYVVESVIPEEAIVGYMSCSRCFVDPARIFSKRRDIIAILRGVHEVAVCAVFAF